MACFCDRGMVYVCICRNQARRLEAERQDGIPRCPDKGPEATARPDTCKSKYEALLLLETSKVFCHICDFQSSQPLQKALQHISTFGVPTITSRTLTRSTAQALCHACLELLPCEGLCIRVREGTLGEPRHEHPIFAALHSLPRHLVEQPRLLPTGEK